MSHFNDGRGTKIIYIAPITKDVEDEIENENTKIILIKLNNKDIKLAKSNIIWYGEMDFTTGSEDYETVKESSIFANNSTIIPANYDYDSHSYVTNENCVTIWETFRPELIVQYFHGLLGKPKRCVIFKRIKW